MRPNIISIAPSIVNHARAILVTSTTGRTPPGPTAMTATGRAAAMPPPPPPPPAPAFCRPVRRARWPSPATTPPPPKPTPSDTVTSDAGISVYSPATRDSP
jgi:hypothetical protein